ncbi:sulfatase [Polaribacter sp. IC073]|uniref:sulfatase family protein n=1 Tax=Polaribacter sp. IC073 TaxID=2508540 RepID=UPI0011BFDA90|nr:sulfatase-like hydrolase/transferase [Polaribacter sp. IC073]TXD46773.1 sulfatase-like hydrolase/transferase [Polaribacter sp. IC073]
MIKQFKTYNRKLLILFSMISIFIYSCQQNEKIKSVPKIASSKVNKPNIVLILTDQHQAKALSIAGNFDVKTPNLDKLAKTGTRFTNAYVTFPLCSPSRSSIFTGKLPHEIGVNSNEDKTINTALKNKNLAHTLTKAGYHAAYGGKWHAPEVELPSNSGFEKIAEFDDIPLAEKSIEYLKSRKDNPQPFFLVASFDNPHSICEWARNQPLPYGNIPKVSLDKTPELPINFEKSNTFPEALEIEQTANKKVYPTQNFTKEDWRKYRYTYYQLVEKVDAEIGKIIDAIEALGLRESTIIIFTSDHGDGNASHGWNQKTALFQESINVPFIISYKDENSSEGKINTSLISSGLDLFPTILDFAEIEIPKELLGKSIKPTINNPQHNFERDFVVTETKFAGKQAYGTTGRALIGKEYKYVLYSWGKNREQFFDLQKDPLEMINLVASQKYLPELDQYRKKLIDWCIKTNDTKFLRKIILPSNSKMSSSKLFDKPY